MIAFSWFISILCLIGSVFNVKKSIWCFYLWGLGNIGWLFFDAYNGVWGRVILNIVQLYLCIWGIIEWRKKNK